MPRHGMAVQAVLRAGAAALVAMLPALAGCATTAQPDPLEPWNRCVFRLNEAVDGAVVASLARGYARALPQAVRTSLGHFFANPQDIGSAANLLLQGRPGAAASDLARVAVNTTVGVLGLFDVATPMGLVRHGADTGQTLGRWGLGAGAYIVWPLLGPSTVRDTAGLPAELLLAPQALAPSTAVRNGLTVLQATQARAELLPATQVIDRIALDKYLFVRDAYLQHRRALVHGDTLVQGDAPPDSAAAGGDERFDLDPGSDAAAIRSDGGEHAP
ncbi:MAG: VacJ family lipoprotein [Pseudomonadota bacterium]